MVLCWQGEVANQLSRTLPDHSTDYSMKRSIETSTFELMRKPDEADGEPSSDEGTRHFEMPSPCAPGPGSYTVYPAH